MSGAARRALVLLALTSAACGGGDDAPTAPDPTPTNPYRVTISSSGVSPTEIVVPPGTRVLFVNSDSRRHDMTSDPHPDHTNCPEINQVGALNGGQSRETGNLVAVRTCGFHDHDDPNNAALQGRIVIR